MGAGSPWPAVWSPMFLILGVKFFPNVKLNNIYLPSMVVLGYSSDKIIKPLPLSDV
jgi:hypothetical protein